MIEMEKIVWYEFVQINRTFSLLQSTISHYSLQHSKEVLSPVYWRGYWDAQGLAICWLCDCGTYTLPFVNLSYSITQMPALLTIKRINSQRLECKKHLIEAEYSESNTSVFLITKVDWTSEPIPGPSSIPLLGRDSDIYYLDWVLI